MPLLILKIDPFSIRLTDQISSNPENPTSLLHSSEASNIKSKKTFHFLSFRRQKFSNFFIFDMHGNMALKLVIIIPKYQLKRVSNNVILDLSDNIALFPTLPLT